MKQNTGKLTLDRVATYEIKVPGELGASWVEWAGEITFKIERETDSAPVTTLIGAFDQAALQGVLRRIYSRGLPIISVIWLGEGSNR